MTVKVSPKYQVVIPEGVRENSGIRPGMQVNVISKGGVIYIIPVKPLNEISKIFSDLFGKGELKDYREKKDRKV